MKQKEPKGCYQTDLSSPYLESGFNAHLRVMSRLNKIMSGKPLAQCLARTKCSVHTTYFYSYYYH